LKKELRVDKKIGRSWIGLLACVGLLLILAGGCAGPKRLPPLDGSVGGSTPRPTRPLGVPGLLTVGLLEGEQVLRLTASGGAVVLGDGSTAVLASLETAGHELVCRRQGDQVTWQAAGRSGRAATVRLQPIDPAHVVRQGDGEYHGEFLVIPTPGRFGLTLINTLDLESYLRGVVPWEIGRHGPDKLAALQAQAVAARTYTISHIGARRDRGFDVFASVMDQVYRGSKDEDLLCNQAIEDTRGLILQHGGQPIDAYYSACCGGVSSHIEEVWAYAPEAYLKSRPDTPRGEDTPFCAEYRYFNWRETWSGTQLEDILQTTLPEYLANMAQTDRPGWQGPYFTPSGSGSDPARPGALHDLEIKSYTSSGRVDRLDVVTEAGVYHVRGDRTRWVLKPASGNPAILRSALFEVELIRRDQVLTEIGVRGRGYGHGIGMCQSGALAMAEDGYTYQQILAHYYSGAKLVEAKND
jgi:stage II sporulation protein D